MGSPIKSLLTVAIASFAMSCESDPARVEGGPSSNSQYELHLTDPPSGIAPTPKAPAEESSNNEAKVSREQYKWWMDFPWRNTVKPVFFDQGGMPIPIESHPRSYYRITDETRIVTIEVHKQIAKAVGLHGDEDNAPDLAKFLTSRSSIETTLQGNRRPFDNRGSTHGLDVKAAYRSGIRTRKKYIEAGNMLAKHEPHVFLGYGQAGMISWLYLDDWDILGDPRMLGDNVIAGLTYRRVMEKSYKRLRDTKIKCYEYNDDGRVVKRSFNGKSYRVAAYAVDEEKASACIDSGPESKGEKSDPEALERRCRRENRKTYSWKVGEPQPANTVPVDKITWWDLKRASGGKPCPAWRGDELEESVKDKLSKRAERFDFDISKAVRLSDLGEEPDGVNQYELWMSIWDATMVALGKEPINWDNLRSIGTEKPIEIGPSKEKIEQERRRARGENINPFAIGEPS